MRRTMLNGIYQGKGCDAPQPQAVQAVTPAPAMPQATGTITYAPGETPPAAPPAQ